VSVHISLTRVLYCLFVGVSVLDMISSTMLYTYVDKDHYNVIKVR
jgi:hypothetical protein